MKKKLTLLFTLVIMGMLAGCASMHHEGELYFPQSDPVSVKEAEVYFNSSIRNFVIVPGHVLYTRGKGEREPVIAWDKAGVIEYFGDTMVEIPLEKFVMAIRDRRNKESIDSIATDTVARKTPPNTVLKLIARKDITGELDFQVVHITGTEEYLESTGRKLNRINLSTLNDFTGEVRYHNLQGEFLYGDKYKNGKIAGHTWNDQLSIIRNDGVRRAHYACKMDGDPSGSSEEE